MTEEQKFFITALIENDRRQFYFAGMVKVIQQLEQVEMSIKGITLPDEPYDESITIDWQKRCGGDSWDEEDLIPKYLAILKADE